MKSQSFLEKYGPWAVVTGASDGIGKEFARSLAKRGMNLVLVARRKEMLETLASELTQLYAIQTRCEALDLGSPESVVALLDRTQSLPVGLWIASAGFGTSGPFHESRVDEELSMIDLNVRSVVQLTRGCVERLVSQKRGGLILMSSLVAFQGVPHAANYAATKAFIQVFAEGLRRELASQGVDVLASAPGPVLSGFGKRAQMSMTSGASPQVVAEASLRALGKQGTVRPGLLSKVLELSLSLLPRRGRVRVMERVMGGMTAHPMRSQ